MPGHQPLPIGTGRDVRARRAGHGGRFTGREVVLRSDQHGAPPAPPHYLDPREVEVFLELWREPVSQLWEPGDAALVALLAQMVVRLEDGATESWVSARIMSLRSALFLSPRTRRASGITIERVEDAAGAQVVAYATEEGQADDDHRALRDELEARRLERQRARRRRRSP